jgi:hypothetical protein
MGSLPLSIHATRKETPMGDNVLSQRPSAKRVAWIFPRRGKTQACVGTSNDAVAAGGKAPGLKTTHRGRASIWAAVAVALMLLAGCAHHYPLPQETQQWAYRVDTPFESGQMRWAPVFIVYGHAQEYNRIGRPTIRITDDDHERVSVDPDHPSIYYMKRNFTTTKATYTNEIYRVHFPQVPYSFSPFNLTAGKNVGVLVVVTLDGQKRPVLVTSVGTCGCYKAFVPTHYLPTAALPRDWNGQRQKVYGEDLPRMLSLEDYNLPRFVFHLRPQVHRVMNLEVLDDAQLSSRRFRSVPMQSYPMELLNRIPVDGDYKSFYHQQGVLKGHVKGSIKPFESLFMSLISLDFFVGMDKAYADPAQTGNPFYTSLKPWRRTDSNMWNFARFLKYWGWRL